MAELVPVTDDDEPERFRFQPRCGKLRLREISRVRKNILVSLSDCGEVTCFVVGARGEVNSR